MHHTLWSIHFFLTSGNNQQILTALKKNRLKHVRAIPFEILRGWRGQFRQTLPIVTIRLTTFWQLFVLCVRPIRISNGIALTILLFIESRLHNAWKLYYSPQIFCDACKSVKNMIPYHTGRNAPFLDVWGVILIEKVLQAMASAMHQERYWISI